MCARVYLSSVSSNKPVNDPLNTCRFPRSKRLVTAFLVGALVEFAFFAEAEPALPEPGPERGGMRLRLMVSPEPQLTNEAYRVRLDVLNVTDQSITLVAEWPHENDRGDFSEYLESEVSIETFPEIIRWMGQSWVGHRESPQPQYTLDAHKTLTLEWTTVGKRLKNKVTHILYTKNPIFPTDGLYSVHATVKLCVVNQAQAGDSAAPANRELRGHSTTNIETDLGGRIADFRKSVAKSEPQGTIFLRSNEQQVPIGGSRQLPKFPLGRVVWADTNIDSATIDLGTLQRIEIGDRFRIWSGYIAYAWELNVTNVGLSSAIGHFELITGGSRTNAHPRQVLPGLGMLAELIPRAAAKNVR